MKHLIFNLEKKFLIDGDTGEVLTKPWCDINRILRDFDAQGIAYTIQIWF